MIVYCQVISLFTRMQIIGLKASISFDELLVELTTKEYEKS